MDLKTYKRKLAGIRKSGISLRDNVQELIVVGVNHAAEHGDTVYLSLLMESTVGIAALRTNTIKNYIKGHINVKYVKSSDGTMVFKKDGKGDFNVQPIESVWYEWDTSGQAKADMDAVAQAKALLKRITSSLESGTVKDAEQAQRIADNLTTVLAA